MYVIFIYLFLHLSMVNILDQLWSSSVRIHTGILLIFLPHILLTCCIQHLIELCNTEYVVGLKYSGLSHFLYVGCSIPTSHSLGTLSCLQINIILSNILFQRSSPLHFISSAFICSWSFVIFQGLNNIWCLFKDRKSIFRFYLVVCSCPMYAWLYVFKVLLPSSYLYYTIFAFKHT